MGNSQWTNEEVKRYLLLLLLLLERMGSRLIAIADVELNENKHTTLEIAMRTNLLNVPKILLITLFIYSCECCSTSCKKQHCNITPIWLYHATWVLATSSSYI
jgi:hypothetical protein